MRVGERRMCVTVGVRLAAIPAGIVRVAMMLVVHVGMLVHERLVLVPVLVALGQMEPHAECHQHSGQRER